MPSTEQLALWAAIRANPEDDTPRLVYADWLQENGDEARAELIRLQCAIARLPDDRQAKKLRPGMEHRERVLLTANRERWAEPILRLFRRSKFPEVRERRLHLGNFRRGFLCDLQLDLDGAYRLVTAGPSLEPIDGVSILGTGRLVGDTKKLEAIANWDHACCFRVISQQYANDEDVYLIVRGRLTRLTVLELWEGSVTNSGAAELASWSGATGLSVLGLHTNRITDTGAVALADSPHLTKLQRLDLRRNPITETGGRRLVASFGAAVLLPDD